MPKIDKLMISILKIPPCIQAQAQAQNPSNGGRGKHKYHSSITNLWALPASVEIWRDGHSAVIPSSLLFCSSCRNQRAHFPRLSSSAGGSPVLAATPRYTKCVRACACLPLMGGEELFTPTGTFTRLVSRRGQPLCC